MSIVRRSSLLALVGVLGAAPVLVVAQSATFRFSGNPAPPSTRAVGLALSRDGGTTLVEVQSADGFTFAPYLWLSTGNPFPVPNVDANGSTLFRWMTGDGRTILGRRNGLAATVRMDGPVTPLPIPNGASESIVASGSRDGAVLGGSAKIGSQTRPVRWSGTSALVMDGGQGSLSEVRDTSDDGSVQVGYYTPAGPSVACRWNAAGERTTLAIPDGVPYMSYRAIATSRDGSFTVGEFTPAWGPTRACLWTPLGWRNLGAPAGFTGNVVPYAISADGSAVVGSLTGVGAARAFLWDRAHGMRDLQSVLLEAGLGSQLAGWTLGEARGVTANSGGITVAGTAGDGSKAQAFVASISAGPTFTPLGDFAGGTFDSQARGLSLEGDTVVGTGNVAGGKRAFVWRIGRGMFDIGAGALEATGVSRDGTVLTGLQANASFIWREGGTNRGLGTTAIAEAISSNGVVAVGSRIGSDGVRHAYRWNGATTEQYTTYVGTHVAPSRALGVSSDGVIFVGATAPHSFGGVAYDARAYRWTNVGGQAFLGDLPGGRVESEALAISADGTTIVGWSHSSNGPEAFRWTAAGGMKGLGDLPGAGFASRALGVSTNGKYIVGSGVRNGTNRAFLWSAATGMRDLKEILLGSGATEVASWILSSATGVTSDVTGRVYVTGTGIDPMGRRQAFHASLSQHAAPAMP